MSELWYSGRIVASMRTHLPHVLLVKLEVEDLCVGLNAFLGDTFRDDNIALHH